MSTNSNRIDISNRLFQVFRDVFDDDTLELTEAMSAQDIPEWDSLAHITLCIALEREFSIKLNPVEMATLPNIGALIDLLVKHIKEMNA